MHRTALVLVLSSTLLPAPALRAEEVDPRPILSQAKSAAVTIPGQAAALAGLAWPESDDVHPQVRAAAREELVRFGKSGLGALSDALLRVEPRYQADVTAAMIEARRRVTEGNPQHFLPGLESAIWHGSSEARRLAINEIQRYYFPPAMLSTIDAIVANPRIALDGIHALGRMGDMRARHFLGQVLLGSAPRYKQAAARSLATLGDPGLSVLRSGARSRSEDVRAIALETLLPLAVTDDLTLLYEYLDRNPDDDAVLLDRLRVRAAELEVLLEQERFAAESDEDGPPGP